MEELSSARSEAAATNAALVSERHDRVERMNSVREKERSKSRERADKMALLRQDIR